MNKSVSKYLSVWSVLAGLSFCGSFVTLGKGIHKMTRYYNGTYSSTNAYVNGDAYNYIINGNYATAFFVLTAMLVLAAIGFVVLHYLHYMAMQRNQLPQNPSMSVVEDIESNLPEI